MPGPSKVIVLDPDERAGRQVQLGFEREGIPTAAAMAGAAAVEPVLESAGADTGLVVVGGVNGAGLDLVRRARRWLDDHGVDAPVVFAGRGATWHDAASAGADEIVRHPAYLRDVVTIGRLLRGLPAGHRDHIVGDLLEVTGVFSLVRALSALGRSATLTLVRGLRRGEVRFYLGEVTSAQVGLIHGQAALHQLLLWTDARFDFHHEDVVRRQQIPLAPDELFADAERFLEGVRDSSGGLSPAMVLEQDLPRVQSFARQIPTEVYGVLRMFDGHRALADVLEDSAYRVFETLRVAQRAVDAGLLRVVAEQPRRPRWRTILPIDSWLVGGELRKTDAEIDAARPSTLRDARGAPAPLVSEPSRGTRKRKKRKQRGDTLPALPAAAPREIDWGALVPRIVGAEVGPLAGVVPASHVSGEIVTTSRPDDADDPGPDAELLAPEPSVVFDEAAVAPVAPAASPPTPDTERAGAAPPDADRTAASLTAATGAAGRGSARADTDDAASEAEEETVRLTMRPPRAMRAATQRAAVDITDLFDDDVADPERGDADPTSADERETATDDDERAAPSADAETAAERPAPTADAEAATARTAPSADGDPTARPAPSADGDPTARAADGDPTAHTAPAADSETAAARPAPSADAETATARPAPSADGDPTARPAPSTDSETATARPAPSTDAETATARPAPSADAETATARPAPSTDGVERSDTEVIVPALATSTAAVRQRAASEPARVVDDLDPGDTKPERPGAIEDAADPPRAKLDLAALAAAAVVQDHVLAVASDAITAPIAASLGATAEPSGTVPPEAAPRLPDSLARDSTPTEIEDEPSDGVVRHHIATAETAPVKRRPPSADPIDDRPGDTTGEITMPRPRPPVHIRYSEPSILVADLELEDTDDQAATPDPDAVQSAPTGSDGFTAAAVPETALDDAALDDAASAEVALAEAASAEAALADAASAEIALAEAALADAASAEIALAEAASAEAALADAASARAAPDAATAGAAAAEAARAKAAPTVAATAEAASAQATSATATPAKATPTVAAPAVATPAVAAPAVATPAVATPAVAAPAVAAPADTAPANAAPAVAALADTAPANAAPANAAPANAAPANAAPANAAPAKATPAKATPAKATPAKATSAKAAPANAAPAKAAPAKAAPAKAAPADAAPTDVAAAEVASGSGTPPPARASGSFTAAEQAFFEAGRERDSGVQPVVRESFDDLDEGYRPVGFWERLRGKLSPHGKPPK